MDVNRIVVSPRASVYAAEERHEKHLDGTQPPHGQRDAASWTAEVEAPQGGDADAPGSMGVCSTRAPCENRAASQKAGADDKGVDPANGTVAEQASLASSAGKMPVESAGSRGQEQSASADAAASAGDEQAAAVGGCFLDDCAIWGDGTSVSAQDSPVSQENAHDASSFEAQSSKADDPAPAVAEAASSLGLAKLEEPEQAPDVARAQQGADVSQSRLPAATLGKLSKLTGEVRPVFPVKATSHETQAS